MRKAWIILVVLAALALVLPVSAFAPITFPYSGDLQVQYVSKSADYNNEFGIALPEFHSLGFIGGLTPAVEGTIYTDIGRCSPDGPVAIVLYITSPDPVTYYSDALGSDGLDHALVSVRMPVAGIPWDLKIFLVSGIFQENPEMLIITM